MLLRGLSSEAVRAGQVIDFNRALGLRRAEGIGFVPSLFVGRHPGVDGGGGGGNLCCVGHGVRRRLQGPPKGAGLRLHDNGRGGDCRRRGGSKSLKRLGKRVMKVLVMRLRRDRLTNGHGRKGVKGLPRSFRCFRESPAAVSPDSGRLGNCYIGISRNY